MGVSKSTLVDSNDLWRHCEKLNLMVDTALGRMLDSQIVTSELSCVAITAVSVWSQVEIMHSNVALSPR